MSSSFAIDLTPPPPSEIPPLIASCYDNDKDDSRVDDALESQLQTIQSVARQAATLGQQQAAAAIAQSAVDVELIFKDPITQAQIDAFLALGGEITYIYQSVSYGWNGRIAIGQVAQLPALLGASLVLVEQARPTKLHLDMATRTGRVRPIWASGFAGNSLGFDGDSSITIGIVDTGIDGTHTDLAGRQQYWSDFTTDASSTPVDIVQHGSHVTGIALGTGAASGSGTGTLHYTDIGTNSALTSGFYPSAIDMPTVSSTWTSVAQWTGGASTTLYGVYHAKGVSGSWYTLSTSATGTSPQTVVNTLTGSATQAYSSGLMANNYNVQSYVIANTVTNYSGVGDGFNKLSGVAPGCRWAGAKVFANDGSGYSSWTGAGIDALVAGRVANNIKVMNLSLGTTGTPGLSTSTRAKVNTAVNDGIVVCCSAGNDGTQTTSAGARESDDPGRAAMAITVAASNDANQLTDYSSHGVASPTSVSGQEEDYKPDVTAPGGSTSYYTGILSVDSNSGDGTGFADQQPNDYYNIQGTSMSSPFVAGCAALIVDAMQQQGVTWDFASSQNARYVKMLLCATATETNTTREGNTYNPTLDRATNGSGENGAGTFPVGKDQYEGYGIINPDAAVEAVALTYTAGQTLNVSLGPSVTDRRASARKVNLYAGRTFDPTLTVPSGADFDLYLYSGTPAAYGTPVILASSTNSGLAATESINYTPSADATGILVVKRISGSGAFSLTSTADTTPPTVTAITPTTTSPTNGNSVAFTVNFSEEVQNFSAANDLVITESGTLTHSGVTFSGGPTSYTVTITDATGDGTMTLAVSTTADVQDMAGNALASSVTSAAVTIDHTAPTASAITLTTSSPTNGSTVAFSVGFSESVQNFTAATDLVFTESGVAHSGVSFSGGQQNYTVTATGVTGNGTMTLAVSTASDVKDLAGNALASSVTSAAATIDHTAPTVTAITPVTTSPTNGNSVAFTVNFSESVQNFDTAADLVFTESGVAHSGVVFSGGPQNYTVTATGVTGNGTIKLAASTASDVKDLAGNALASSVTSAAVTVDQTAPTATAITPTTTSPTNGSSVAFSVAFSESVQNFNAAGDLAIAETGTVAHTGVLVAGGPQNYTVTVSGVTGDGTIKLAANTASDVKDLAGNALASSVTSAAVTVDHTAPAATALTPVTSSPTNSASAGFTVSFSESVQNFDAATDLVFTETGTVAHTGVLVAGGPQTYTVTVSGVTGDGTMALAVSTASDVKDLAGNALVSSGTSAAITFDHTAPTAATITPTTTSPTNGNSVAFTVAFSESVQNFNVAGDLTISETGTVAHTGVSFSGGPQSYTVTVSGVIGDGTMRLAVNTASDVKDLAGNALASSVTSATVTLDHTAPTAATITPTTTSPANGNSVAFTVAFSEEVQNFNTSGDLTITETGTVAHTGVSISGGPQNYTATVTGVTGDGTMLLAVNTASDVKDLAGNALASSVTSASVTLDHTAPTATSVAPTTASPTNSSSVSFTVTFSESVQNLNATTDLVVTETGGVAHTGMTITGGPQNYTVTLTGVTGDGTMLLAVNTASDVKDLAGNALASSATSTAVVLDHSIPTVSAITPAMTGPTNAGALSFSVNFSESVQGFDTATDLLFTETGTVAYSGISITGGPQNYTVAVAGITGDGTMRLAVNTASDVKDSGGNALASSVTSAVATFDHSIPFAGTVSPAATGPTNANTIVFAVLFSENVQNFDTAADVVVSETGTVAHTGVSITGGPQNYAVTVNGVTGDGTLRLAVNTGSDVKDSGGNALSASATSAAVTFDHTAPAATSITPATASPANGNAVVFNVAFSESVQNFDAATDLAITETGTAAHTGASITGGPQNYAVTVTGVTGDGAIGLAVNTGSDVKDLAGNVLASSVTSPSVTFDHTAPAATAITPVTASPANGNTVVFTVTFGESVQNFSDATDLVVTETGTATHTGASIIGGPQNYTVTVTSATGDGAISLAVNTTSDVKDLAGNALASSVTSSSVTLDHTAPAATAIAPVTASPANANTIAFSVAFSESVQNFGAATDLNLTETGTSAHTGASITGGPQNYTVTVMGVTGDGTMALAVSTGSDVKDLAGNALASSVTSASVTLDHTAPTVSAVTIATANPTNAATVGFDVNFSEDIKNLDAANDLVVTETGTVAHAGVAFSGGPRHYTVTLTSVTGDGTIRLAPSVASDVQDLAGNLLTTTLTSGAVFVDHTAPMVLIDLLTPGPTGADSVQFRVTFSEPVAPKFDAGSVVIAGTLAGTAQVEDDADPVYTVTVSLNDPAADGTIGIALGAGIHDPAGNACASVASALCVISNWKGFAAGQPESVQAYVGDAPSFHVAATCAAPDVAYQWKWRDMSNAVHDAPSQTAALSLAGVTQDNRGAYWCELTCDGQTHASDPATLSVEEKPYITQQPQGAALYDGRSYTLSVAATGGYAPLTYHWSQNGVGIAESNAPSFGIASMNDLHAGAYTVVVMDALGTTAASDPAQIVYLGNAVPVAGAAGLAVLGLSMIAVTARRRRR